MKTVWDGIEKLEKVRLAKRDMAFVKKTLGKGKKMRTSEESRKYHIALFGELDFLVCINRIIEEDDLETKMKRAIVERCRLIERCQFLITVSIFCLGATFSGDIAAASLPAMVWLLWLIYMRM